MEELDKLFRQRMDELDTPPPQSQWTPQRSWDRLEGLMQEPAMPAKKPYPWYSIAAAVLLLLIPFTWLLIRLEQETEPKVALRTEPTEKRNAVSNTPPDTIVPLHNQADKLAETHEKPPFPATKNRVKLPVSGSTASPEHTPDSARLDHLANRQEPVCTQPENSPEKVVLPGEAASPDGPEAVKSYLSQTATADRQGKATTITLVFPGRGDSAETVVSRETVKPRRSKILRLFTNSHAGEQPAPAGEPANIFSILTEKQQQ